MTETSAFTILSIVGACLVFENMWKRGRPDAAWDRMQGRESNLNRLPHPRGVILGAESSTPKSSDARVVSGEVDVLLGLLLDGVRDLALAKPGRCKPSSPFQTNGRAR
jgi:hypothetical protein